MKKMSILFMVSFFVLAFCQFASAQLLLENFDYGTTAGDLTTLTSNWSVHSGTGTPEQYLTTSLTYAGYTASGIGGSATFAGGSGSRQDINSQMSDSVAATSAVYVSFLVNLTSASTNDYFFHLGPKTLGTTFRGRVFARDTSSGTGWALGLSKSSEAPTNDTTTILNYNQTYLIVLKYEFNSTATDDDQVTLYAYDSGVPASEPGSPIVTIGPIGAGVTSDPSDIGSVAIRQGTNSAAGTIDGIQVSTSWDLAAGTPVVSTFYPIDSLKVNDANGISQKLNDTVNTTGIVTSITQLGTGTSGPGTIQNDSTAISIYGSTFTGTAGLQIGDSVVVKNWKVTQYNGLTELSYTDSSQVEIVSNGHTVNPRVLTIADIKNQAWDGFEKYEGMLVRFNNVQFVQTGTFDIGTSSGYNFQFTDGTDTLDFRIVKTNTSLIGKNIPPGHVDLIGFVQQYKSSTPYNSGYQIFPLDSTGIISQAITPIDSLRINDVDGNSKMLNDTVNTTGIVTAVLELGTGTSGPGTIQNSNAAMSVYGTSFTQTPGIQRGDSVLVENWKVTQYNGLTELSFTANSSVRILSSGHSVTPMVVTIPEIKGETWNGFEQYESKLLQLNSVRFVQTGVFDVGTSSGVNYQIYNGTDTLDLRIVKTNTSLLGKTIPTGDLNIVGVLTQYDPAIPYDAGYQFLPRDSADITTITAVDNNQSKPFTFQLYQNYPNPFNPSTVIRFEVPKSEKVELKVYDILGREVRTLYNAVAPQGITTVNFDASNLATGVYIYTIRTANATISKKLMLLK